MGLERIRRLRPFRRLSAGEFRTFIEAIREEARGTASGGIEGISGPEGLLLAQRPAKRIDAFVAVADQAGDTIDVQHVRSDGVGVGDTITAYVLP